MSKSAAKRSRPPASASAPATPIPTPFTKAPAALQPFLDLLDPSQVYLTHIDRFPAQAKRNIFLIPVLLNLAIALLLLWRLKAAVPTYWALFQTFLGYPSSATVDTETTTRTEQMRVVLARTAMFAFDFVAVRFVGPWPLTFFLEQPANPVTWRWKLRFRDAEIVVRASRNWGAEGRWKEAGCAEGKVWLRKVTDGLHYPGRGAFMLSVVPSAHAIAALAKPQYLFQRSTMDDL